MSKLISVGEKQIGDGKPIYIMADLGLTNGGNLSRAKELIDIARDANADAVKFQMIGPDYLIGDRSVTYTYPTLSDGPRTENMYEMFQGLNYSINQWEELFRYTYTAGLEFICTAHFFEAVDILEKLGVAIHKICTWSATHKRLIQRIGHTGKPLMLDTGVYDLAKFEKLKNWFEVAGGKQMLVLHDFHTSELDQMNFNSIKFIKENFNLPVGYTPQGRGTDHDFLSVGLGANILEKRLTTDRSIPENGHIKALEPAEFKLWVKRIRDVEKSLGSYSIMPTNRDQEDSRKYFKSLYAKVGIEQGEVVKEQHLCAMRPGTGISAALIDDFIGRIARVKISGGSMLKHSFFYD